MQAVRLENNVLSLFERFFSDVKNKIRDTVDVQSELSKILGTTHLDVIVADDDNDDYEFFTDAMSSIVPNIHVLRANDGVELLKILEEKGADLPGIIFLDLNMPCKSGMECLDAIKSKVQWKDIPVIIYSTSANQDQIDTTYRNGANLYIQKPNSFIDIKNVVRRVFTLSLQELSLQPAKEKYLFKL